MTRPTRDEVFLGVARLVATRSTCLRRNVGCVLVNARGHVLSTGYNGVAAGQPHCNEPTGRVSSAFDSSAVYTVYMGNACSGATSPSGTNLEGCEAIHAEQNALLQCPDVYDINTCYCTASPCVTCTKLLLNTSCRRIVFLEEYPHGSAKDLWMKNGRIWTKGAAHE